MDIVLSSEQLFELLVQSGPLCEKDRELIKKMSEENSTESGVDFSKPWTYADITFLVEDKRIYACKMILSMWSPVFEAMFSDNFKEKNAKEIALPGKNYDDVLELMKILHPPNKEICNDNVLELLPLIQEYQIDVIQKRAEEFLMTQVSSVKNFLIAQKFNLKELYESNFNYLKRAPVARLKSQPDFEELDKEMIVELLMEKCLKFEENMDALREVRMVLERKKPTTFPGMHLLCDNCTGARQQQVDCDGCMKNCCKKITDILRNLER